MKINKTCYPEFIALALILVAVLVAAIVGATQDTTAPYLTAFSFTPTTLNTSAGAQSVTFTMTIADDLSGFSSGIIYLDSYSASNQMKQIPFNASNRASGTANNGVYSVTTTLPQYSATGTWQVYIKLTDIEGNTTCGYGKRGGPTQPEAGMIGFDQYSSASRFTTS